jgi:DMSO reductase family type II enzyme heme b subunit
MPCPIALALLLAAAPAPAAGPAAGLEALEVRDLSAPLPTDPAAPAWDGLPAVTVLAAPQRSIRLHDAAANAALADAGPRPVTVRAATDGRSLAVVLEWADDTQDRAGPAETDRYGDGAAVQFPLRSGAGVRLPYVGMGDEGEPVAVFMLRATAADAARRSALGTGFGALARADLGPLAGGLRYDPAARRWRALFVRPLAAGGLDLGRGLLPFAVAVWDGSRHERGGNKALSGWRVLRQPRLPLDAAHAAELSWGRGQGDAARGRTLFEGSCTVCHATATQRDAAPGLAPDLSSIGVIASPAYLRDSLLTPSVVIVPNPNPRQHQDRAAPREAGGGWAADDGYVWFVREPDGRRTSSMPDYASLPAQDLSDLVAYLMTLGAPAPGPGRTP